MTFEEIVPIWLAILATLLYGMYVWWATDRRLLELEEIKE